MGLKEARTGGESNIYYRRYSNYSDYMEATTIQVDSKVRDLLKSFGRKGETYNDIILKLIERARYIEFMRETYNILDTEENWVSLDEL
jgi:predicted CopG family antitoxin